MQSIAFRGVSLLGRRCHASSFPSLAASARALHMTDQRAFQVRGTTEGNLLSVFKWLKLGLPQNDPVPSNYSLVYQSNYINYLHACQFVLTPTVVSTLGIIAYRFATEANPMLPDALAAGGYGYLEVATVFFGLSLHLILLNSVISRTLLRAYRNQDDPSEFLLVMPSAWIPFKAKTISVPEKSLKEKRVTPLRIQMFQLPKGGKSIFIGLDPKSASSRIIIHSLCN